jgi:primosomal protein N' (replication factor Y)
MLAAADTSLVTPDLWEVAVALPLPSTLTYRLPPELAAGAKIGCLVQVPVGRRLVSGYLLGPATSIPPATLKAVAAVLDPEPRFPPGLVPLLRWVSDYYRYPLGEALKHLLPGGAQPAPVRLERWVFLCGEGGRGVKPFGPPLDSAAKRLGSRARQLLAHLGEQGPLPVAALAARFPGCRPVLRRLAARGLVAWEERPAIEQTSGIQELPNPEGVPALLPEQVAAREAIVRAIRQGGFVPFLLHGVTASGKTEVYLAAAAEALSRGRQVLVLAPEIALTHPLAREFTRRFGPQVTLLHSGLSEAQRLAHWRRIARGEAEVVVGARSAVFAPLTDPGLIVVDEEHDPAYKHEGGLPYQARDVALFRAKQAGAAAVLVSATPAVSTYYRARAGNYAYLNLSRRATPQELPRVELVDLRRERGSRGLKVISRPLVQALGQVLEQGHQALLFLNRRGYAAVVFCLLCGQVLQCRQCSVALTYHQSSQELVCHYCGFRQPVPEVCPQCHSALLKRYGVGTERVEAEVRRLFPAARVARLDRDIAPHSGKALRVFEEFASGEVDVLVGTQMITKGHHFPKVTLVGVIAGDLSLFFPEYHAGERTFQLLAQVAGRAGRGEAPGRVLIQTYNPEHYVFQTVREQDYERFFEAELEARRSLGYPPFTRLALIRLSGPVEATVAQAAQDLARGLKRRLAADPQLNRLVGLLGPAPAGLAKLKGRFRWQLLLKSHGRPPLAQTLDLLPHLWSPPPKSKIDLTLDIDPGSLF